MESPHDTIETSQFNQGNKTNKNKSNPGRKISEREEV